MSEKLLRKMVLSYELHKNQAYVERLLKEGEIEGYKKILNIYKSASIKNKIIDEKDLIIILQGKIKIATDELFILKAQENIFNLMNKDLEDNLVSLDLATLPS